MKRKARPDELSLRWVMWISLISNSRCNSIYQWQFFFFFYLASLFSRICVHSASEYSHTAVTVVHAVACNQSICHHFWHHTYEATTTAVAENSNSIAYAANGLSQCLWRTREYIFFLFTVLRKHKQEPEEIAKILYYKIKCRRKKKQQKWGKKEMRHTHIHNCTSSES